MKPAAVINYTGNMAGMDHSDPTVSYMPMHRKTIKWWKKLAFHFLTLSMIQAHCLYLKLRKQLQRKLVTLEDFATSVCYDLARLPADKAAADLTGAAASVGDDVNRLACCQQHFMEKLANYKRCHVCYAKDKAHGAAREQLKSSVLASSAVNAERHSVWSHAWRFTTPSLTFLSEAVFCVFC